ncbi:MAG: dienelactone hydrolase family protein [Pseudomonadota bacterium]
MSFRILILSIVLLIVACSSPIKEQSDAIFTVVSHDYKFIDQLLYGDAVSEREIDILLTLPNPQYFSPPYPAIVLLHSSWGLSSQEWLYANEFKDMGIATLAIDSFSPRDVGKTSRDQTLVSSASMIKDAYATLEYISTNPEFDENKVAVMGFSKGGIVAMYSVIDQVRAASTNTDLRFNAHIAYYPWCGMAINNMKTTGAPVLIQAGAKDIVTPLKACRELITEDFSQADQSTFTIKEYSKARHAFDHPILSRVPFPISLTAQVPANCKIEEKSRNNFYEIYNNKPIYQDNVAEVLEACSQYKGKAGYNKQAASQALLDTKEFLKLHLLD